jgi:hypothetical protein
VLKTLLDEALPSDDDSRTFHLVYTSAAASIPQTTVFDTHPHDLGVMID